MARKAKQSKNTLPFRHHLVLNQWLFSLFGFDSLSGNYDLGNREAPTLEAFRDRFQLIGVFWLNIPDTSRRDKLFTNRGANDESET